MVFVIEKYIPINGVENFISNADGLGINWLRQTYLYFIISSALYFVISALDNSPQQVDEKFFAKDPSKPKDSFILWVTGVLVVVMLFLYFLFY